MPEMLLAAKLMEAAITATNQALTDLVARGQFREDPLLPPQPDRDPHPPLRERPHDIDELVTYCLPVLGQSLGVGVRGIEDDAMQWLKTRAWRGNVRELLNVLGMAIIRGDGDAIRNAHIIAEARVVGTPRDEKRAAAILKIHPSTLYRKLTAP